MQHDCAIGIGHADDPHPRNTCRETYANPMLDLKDAAGILFEVNGCRKPRPSHDSRITLFDSTQGVESVPMSFIVNRPAGQPGLRLVRSDQAGRGIG